MTGDTELRRALWRWEYGHLSATRVKRLLRTAYGRTTRGFEALEGAVPDLRRHAPGLLAARDRFRARGDDALRRERWREALHEILRGRRLLAEMEAVAAAAARLREAEAAAGALAALAASPAARALPSLRAPVLLVETARTRLAAGRWTQAAYLAGRAVAEAAPLQRRERDPARAALLQARLRALGELLTATRERAGDGDADPVADGTLAAATARVEDGHLALAERIADELAFALEARLRFHRELLRDAATLPAPAPPSGGGWSAAAAGLRRARVEAGLARAAVHRARLEHARASLEGASTFDHPAPAPVR